MVSWGDRTGGGNSAAVQHQLQNVQKVQSTKRALAAILSDGSVVVWGDEAHGGNCSSVQSELQGVQLGKPLGYLIFSTNGFNKGPYILIFFKGF